ncbi:hypothetical protein GOP47_0013636 [Adiantum capillus-veneris]|uniref:Uncharacterized protein n=1 Tax=Adiantum capillus-veneris TaxID=13818 RepID=A0A9D4UNW8_ADICA|nr:hypothetical protein GOP47_0013636 [Adiantum capillus-veneris]
MDSEPEETSSEPSIESEHSRLSTTIYGNLYESEEDTREDLSGESSSNIYQNQNLNKKQRSYKRRRYQANVRARINKERSTAEWLSYLGACDAHRKLVENWGEHLQSVMWCSPRPIDLAQLKVTEPKLSRTIRRRQNRELVQQQKEAELKERSPSGQDPADLHTAPEHFKSYTTGERKVVYAKAQQIPTNGSSGVYDGPAVVKEIELAEPGEEFKPVFIAQDLTKTKEAVLKELLKEYKDIFAWTYHDMKGVPPSVVQHTIPMINIAKPVQQ